MIVEALIRTASVEIILKAAEQLEVDVVKGDVREPFTKCYFDVLDYGQLVSIGYIAGLDVAYEKIKPSIESMEVIQQKIKNLSTPTE